MRSDRSQFEVRCPSCKVTFPVGTRVCVHCGGATVASEEAPSMGASAQPVFDFEGSFEGGSEGEPIATVDRRVSVPEHGDDSGFDSESRFELEGEPSLEEDGAFRQTEGEDSETPSLGRSIIGSMGSLIWIAMLIAFSLAGRVCGE